jgi:transposase InsO family protein
VREAVIQAIDEMGPGTGVKRLRALFPRVARRELEDLLHRYRVVYRHRHRSLAHTLTWLRPGVVWAMDYTDPPQPVDGLYEQILVARDLASGHQLLALPVPRESGWQTAAALNSLFLQHGPPLVVKSDNGSTVRAAPVRSLLEADGVLPLVSPPETPTFNGSCEAGIGQLKTRAHHLAARRGYPGEWTCSDVEGARLMGNQTARPHGFKGPTPDEAWAHRRPITQDERRAFRETVETYLRQETSADIDLTRVCGKLYWNERSSAAARRAIRRALIELGYLVTRWRRIPQPIRAVMRTKIT